MKVGTHNRLFQYSIGISLASGFSFEVDVQCGNIEDIANIDFLQVEADGILRRIGQYAIDAQIAFFMGETKFVDVHFP